MSTSSAIAKSIFLQAVELPTAGARQAYLDAHCGADADLRREVDGLLQVHGEVGSFLESPPTVIAQSAEQLRTNVQESPSLRFLQPSSQPGSLGRLGRHEVLEVVGSGGMGVVLKAFDEQLQRIVAIKALADSLASNEHARRRFVREGRAAAAIRDDHVIGIYGVDETNGLPFLVMEYVVGRSLAQRLESDGPLPLADILRIGSQIARGLAAAHAQGLVHRDIKPANILLENGVERVKITDFGLAHAVDDVRTTQPGTVVGTPEYMSPEQARGERVDHRSDLFSLGCVLYAMCAGRPPFRADSTVAILRRICDDTPRPLTEINPDIPTWLVGIIDRLIAKDSTYRFQSAGEVAELLEQCLAQLQECGAGVPPAIVAISLREMRPLPHSPSAASRVPGVERSSTPASRRHWALAAAIIVLLGVGLTLAESTGLTSVTATVIRIVRGDGTLVVEIDDPNIQVLVDGEELVISGAGPKEIRLRPGQHELQSVKDGKAVETKLVTITRDGRQVVKVAHEQAALAPARQSTRFVLENAKDFDSVSPDGRYLAFTDWDTGDVAIRDVTTGQDRHVTKIGAPRTANGFGTNPQFFADGTHLAFTWNYPAPGSAQNSYELAELRVVPVAGGETRVVFSEPEKYWPACYGSSPDGKWILAGLNGSPERMDFARVGVTDRTVQIVHTVSDWRKNKVGQIRLSPDGQTIAYNRLAEPASAHAEIFLIDMQSGEETQITSYAADKQVLGWTPDGSLLYDMERQGARDAWLLRVASSKPRGEAKLVKKDLGTVASFGITRDGTLYYGSRSRGPSLYIATLDLEKGTAGAIPLAAEKFNILDQLFLNDWSPDGEYLAYGANVSRPERTLELRILSVKSGQTRAFKLAAQYWTNRYRWSPDGRSFLGQTRWNEGAGRQYPGIDLIDAVSGQATTVVEAGTASRPPVWAPDGRGVFYHKGDNATGGQRRIVYRDLESRMERDILPLAATARSGLLYEPSPDGRQLAVLSRPDRESLALAVVSVDGGAARELFKGSTTEGSSDVYNRALAWTPDSKYILFKRGGGDAQSGLLYIAAEGGEARKLAVSGVDGKNINVIAMHPEGKQLALSVSGTGKSEIWALENFLPPLADSKPPAAAPTSTAKSP